MATNETFNKKAAVKASAMLEELDKLAAVRKEFEDTDWARTNQKLYSILGDVYARYEEAAANTEVLSMTVKALAEILKGRGNRVQQNTPAMSLFVRYVFNSERQRIFTYARAIHAAKASGVEPAKFVDFVNEAGGIEECKAKVAPNAKVLQKQQQIAEAMPLVEEILAGDGSTVLAEFKVDSQMVDSIKDRGVAFMVGTCDAKGNIKVRSVIPAYSEGFEKWAKEKMAEYLHAHKAESSKKAAEAEQEISLEKALAVIAKVNAGTVKVGELA